MSALDAVNLSDWDVIARLAVGLGLGTAIGTQREMDGHDAGVRTHALLSLGSALFGVVSVGAFSAFVGPSSDSNVQIDVTRIASYLVAGVGFLAGGSIVKSGNRVRGLTTAASLWITAAIGLASGLGFYVGTVATLVMLMLEKPLARVIKPRQEVTVRAVVQSELDAVEIAGRLPETGRGRREVRRVLGSTRLFDLSVSGVPLAERDSVLASVASMGEVVELATEFQ